MIKTEKKSNSKIFWAFLLTLPFALGLIMNEAGEAAFPEKPITLIVPFGAGGGTDLIGRKLAEVASKNLGQPIAIVNTPGAGSAIGLMQCKRAKPDGYTLVLTAKNIVDLPYWGTAPEGLTYQAFEPILRLNFDPATVTVNTGSPWKTLSDFVAAAKSKPETIRYGHGGVGSSFHISVLLFQRASETKFILVPFGGQAPAITALLGKHIEAVPASPGEVAGHVRGGALRILAVMSDDRSPLFPEVPAATEAGVKISSGTWRGILAPKGTPPEVVKKLHDAFQAATRDKDYKDFMMKLGFSIDYMDSKAFGLFMEAEDKISKRLSEELKVSK